MKKDNKPNLQQTALFLTISALTSFLVLFIIFKLISASKSKPIVGDTVLVQSIATDILANGQVRSQNEATLHFATAGKVVFLPFKEGDSVGSGQVLASLDTYTIQKQLQAALNNYRSTRDVFDQTKDNAASNALRSQLILPFDPYAKAGMADTVETHAIDDVIKRIINENQANLDNSVIQVELANYAFTLASVTSPIAGVLVHTDVDNANVFVTPQNSFVVVNTDALIFRANVSEDEVSYITEGALATIKLNGLRDVSLTGVVTKIYPDKITLPTGENVYQIDVESEDLASYGKYKQGGVALIQNNRHQPVVLVPSWLILSDKYIWALVNNKPKLVTVTDGETVGDKTEITSGLSAAYKIIVNPSLVASKHYLVF